MSRPRFVVRDVSIYVRPDGGRFSQWAVVDRLGKRRREICSSRAEARDEARERNTAAVHPAG